MLPWSCLLVCGCGWRR